MLHALNTRERRRRKLWLPRENTYSLSKKWKAHGTLKNPSSPGHKVRGLSKPLFEFWKDNLFRCRAIVPRHHCSWEISLWGCMHGASVESFVYSWSLCDTQWARCPEWPCANEPTNSISRPTRRTYARPLRPARAVLPQRCEKALGSDGGSNWITTSTFGISSPRAATSVVRRTEGWVGIELADAKLLRVRVRVEGGRWPWSE